MKRNVVIFTLLVPVMALSAYAGQTSTGTAQWTNQTGDKNWSTPGNWLNGTVPTSGQAVTFSNSSQGYDVNLDASSTVDSLAVSGSYVNVSTANSSSLTIGTGGLTASSASLDFNSGMTFGSNQQWNLDQYSYVTINAAISEPVAAGFSLTQTGSGQLELDQANSFSGGFTLAGGTTAVGADGALGTGPVSLQSGTTLSSSYNTSSVSLANDVSLANNVTLGSQYGASNLTFTGAVTVENASPATTITIPKSSKVSFGDSSAATDSLTGASADTNLTFAGPVDTTGGTVVLAASVTNIASLTADGTRLMFAGSSSLPTTSIQSLNDGYIGLGSIFDGAGTGGHLSMSSVLNLITDPTNFSGTIGFDTDSNSLSMTGSDVFYGTIDLSQFTGSGFLGLGTATSATLAASDVITLPSGGNYRFGGGGGRLVVASPLSAASAGLTVSSPLDQPLTLVLQGANSFTGNLSVSNSYLIFDSSGAYPGIPGISGPIIQLGASGYIGYTENWKPGGNAATPADLIRLLDTSNLDPTAILGLDSSAPATSPRTVSDNIDLSILPTSIYIGTTTQPLTLTGTITPAQDGVIKLAGLNGGTLDVSSVLSDNGIGASPTVSVVVGHPNAAMGNNGTVVLGGANTYTGGTTLVNGALVVTNNSALGTGDLLVSGSTESPVLMADNGGLSNVTNVSLSNNIIDSSYSFVLGAAGGTVGLTLNGVISGSGGLDILGPTTLNGANTYSGDTTITNATVTAGNAAAFGSGFVYLDTATINSTASALNIGTLGSSDTSEVISAINLAAGSTFTINQTSNDDYYGMISDPGTTGAALVKNGTAILNLHGADFYGGGTTVNAGILVAGSSDALGTGSVIVNHGGALGLDHNAVITNPVTLDGTGGSSASRAYIGGFGTLDGSLTVGAFTGISPGAIVADDPSVVPLLGQFTLGTLAHAVSLTFASNGAYVWGIQDTSGPAGVLSGTVQVNGTLVFNTPAADPAFIFQLESFDATGSAGALQNIDFSQPQQWILLSSTNALPSLANFNYTFDVSKFQLGAFSPGEFSLGLSTDGKSLLLNFTPVPEPSTYALLALGLAVLCLDARRRKRRRA